MNNLNESLLKTIDSIDENIMESEMSVLCSMMDEYTKMGMLMEYADESVIEEYSIINENDFILEGFRSKSKTDEKKKDDKTKKENIFVRAGKSIVKAIKTIFTWIIQGYIKFIEYLVEAIFGALFDTDAKAQRDILKTIDKATKNGKSFEDLTDKELEDLIKAIDDYDPYRGNEGLSAARESCQRILSSRRKEKEKQTRDNFKFEVVDKDSKLSDKEVEEVIESLKQMYSKLQHDSPEMDEKKHDSKKLEELWKKYIVDSKDSKVKEAVNNIEKQNKSLKLTFDNAFKNGHFTPLGFLNKFIDDIMWIGNNLQLIDDKFTKRIDQAISYPCIYTEISTSKNNERIKQDIEDKINKLKSISITDAKTKLEDDSDAMQKASNLINSKLLPYVSKQTAEMFAYNHAIMKIYKELG